ncbi:MAG: FAD-binding oxidoreductase [Acidimicrobiia bacterium]|nr:FAD-binding oxidoreductase [Acidimicrobiia bacterium]
MAHNPAVVIVGAGIAGVSAAYALTVDRGVDRVTVVDPRAPLTLTSDKSTESYRNLWPDRAMVGLINRSIDILEGLSYLSDNAFRMNRRGYLFVTSKPSTFDDLASLAETCSSLGGGPVRSGAEIAADGENGFDLLDSTDVSSRHRYLTEDAVGAVAVRRAGWLDAQQLGAWMLQRARAAGATLERGEVTDVVVSSGTVIGVKLRDGTFIEADAVVNAAGPFAGQVAAMAGVDLPLHSELHLKVVFQDRFGVLPREAPMLIWCDPQLIDWAPEERNELLKAGRDELVGELPLFCHGRPEGGPDSRYVVGLWEYDKTVIDPTWPLPIDELYAELVIRGLSRMIPGMQRYREALPETAVDGGYYTKTPENRPLIGPTGPDGFHVMVGLSGFGIMAAAGAAELLADHLLGAALPEHAQAFLPARYEDSGYMASVGDWETGQL